MLPAKPNRLVQAWFNWYCRYALRKFFHRVHLFGDVPFDPQRPTLYVANHVSFWDPIVLNFLIRTRRRQPAFCMSDLKQVKKHPFFLRVGAFSVDRDHPRDGLRAIQYAADLLNRMPCAVVIFPQGKIEPAEVRPLRFQRGIDRLMKQSPEAAVVIVALRYEYWSDQRAELLVDLSEPSERSAEAIQLQMTDRLEALAAAGREFRPGAQILLRGRQSISEMMAASTDRPQP